MPKRSTADIFLVLIGEGVKRAFLEEESIKQRLSNIRFLPNLSKEQLAELLPAAKIGMNPNTNIHHNRMAIPVKMFDYMACELPVVLANDGEVKTIVEQNGAGFCTQPGDTQSFVAAVLNLYRDEKLRADMGKRGRQLVLARYSIEALAREFEKALS